VRVTGALDDPATRDRTSCRGRYPLETEGVHFREEMTYAGRGVVNSPDIISFNHGLGEIFTALQDAGMTTTSLQEHREVPWNPLGDAMVSSPDHPGEYVLATQRDRLPLTYTLQAAKEPTARERDIVVSLRPPDLHPPHPPGLPRPDFGHLGCCGGLRAGPATHDGGGEL
jgi:hypothetical protein